MQFDSVFTGDVARVAEPLRRTRFDLKRAADGEFADLAGFDGDAPGHQAGDQAVTGRILVDHVDVAEFVQMRGVDHPRSEPAESADDIARKIIPSPGLVVESNSLSSTRLWRVTWRKISPIRPASSPRRPASRLGRSSAGKWEKNSLHRTDPRARSGHIQSRLE